MTFPLTHTRERNSDLVQSRQTAVPAVVARGAAPDQEPLQPLSLIPGTVWDQVGWWEQVSRNRCMSRANGVPISGEGAGIRRRRLRAGLSQGELACRIGVTQVFVSMIELGDRPIPCRLAPLIDLALAGAMDGKEAA